MRVLVIAHGVPPSRSLLASLAAQSDLVVAADGGAMTALEAGLMPDAVVGDLDSLALFPDAGIPPGRIKHDRAADTTDLEKAVRHALALGATAVDVTAAGGGRADHALANLSVLTRFRGSAIALHDDDFVISLVAGEATIDAEPGTIVSLVALGECHGVSTRGLRWDLQDFTLTFGPRGIHNEVARPPAAVAVRTGDLLLFRGRRVERHP